MTTFAAYQRPATMRIPTREELRDMMVQSTAVAITLIISCAVVLIVALSGVVFLAYTGHETGAIGGLVTAVLAALGLRLSNGLAETRRELGEIKAQQATATKE